MALAACDARTFKGPLAAAADSAAGGMTLSQCDTANVDLGFPKARLPLRSCELTRSDTTVSLILDGGGQALVVRRVFPVDSTRQRALHDSIQFLLGGVYGAPFICAPSGDPARREVRLWKTLDRELVLESQGPTQIVFEIRADHPSCEEVG
jgi:hypothetical protein